jgi:hypothetical protein
VLVQIPVRVLVQVQVLVLVLVLVLVQVSALMALHQLFSAQAQKLLRLEQRQVVQLT